MRRGGRERRSRAGCEPSDLGARSPGPGGAAAAGSEGVCAPRAAEAVRQADAEALRAGLEAENRRRKLEPARVAEERDIPRRREPASRAGPEVVQLDRFHRAELAVRVFCRMLPVHLSRFHRMMKESVGPGAWGDAQRTDQIRRTWTESGKIHGGLMWSDALRDPGECVSENRGALLERLVWIAAQLRGRAGRASAAARCRGSPRTAWSSRSEARRPIWSG